MKTHRHRRQFQPAMNALEPRCLMSGLTVNLTRSGVLGIVGTENADVIRVTQAGNRIRVQGVPKSFALGSIRRIQIEALDGDDLIEVTARSAKGLRRRLPSLTVDGGQGLDQVFVSGMKPHRLDVDQPQDGPRGLGVTDPPQLSPVVSWEGDVGTLDYSAWTTPVVVDLRAGVAPGVSNLSGITRVIGSQADDTILGTDGDDVLIGGGGNDRIEGLGGNDWIEGGEGIDLLLGGDGADVLHGGLDVDYLEGGEGADELRGGPDNDILNGGAGDDWLSGGTGNDVIFTGDGRNSAYGDDGDDLLVGGSDGDSLQGGDGTDFLFGLGGNDTIDGDAGNDFIDAGWGADSVRGGLGNDVVEGSEGSDRIEGGDGTDLLFGSDGNDRIEGGAGVDLMVGGSGGDVLRGGESTDLIFGGSGDDELYGDGGRDLLLGGDGSDELRGGDDLDILDGGGSYDYIWGEGGDDVYLDDLIYLWGVPVYIGANSTYLSDPGINVPLNGHLTTSNSYLTSNITPNTSLAPTSSNNMLRFNDLSASSGDSELTGHGLFYTALDYNIDYTTSDNYGLGHVALGGFSPTAAWVSPSMRPMYASMMSTITGHSLESALRTVANSGL